LYYALRNSVLRGLVPRFYSSYLAAVKDTLSIFLPADIITWLFAGEKEEATGTKTRIVDGKAAKINRKARASPTWKKKKIVA